MATINITKSNFFWTLGNKVVWNIRDFISSNYDEWIAHQISWFPIAYIETHHNELLKEYHKQPTNHLRRIIQTQDFDEMQKIFSKNIGKAVDYQIRFYQEFLEAFFPYFESIIKHTGGNEKDKFEFMVRAYNRFVSPIIHSDQQEQMPYNIDYVVESDSTKDDINRIITHFEEFLKTERAFLDTFVESRYGECVEDFSNYIEFNRINPTFQKNKDKKAKLCKSFETSMEDFKPIAKGINKYFIEMEDHIKNGIPKRASRFKLSKEFNISYLNGCNNIVKSL